METAIKPKKRLEEGEERRFAPHCILATQDPIPGSSYRNRCFVEAASDKLLIQLAEEERLRTGLLYPCQHSLRSGRTAGSKRPTPLHQSSLQRSGPKVNECLKKWPLLIGRRYVCKHAATEFVKAQVRVRWTPRQGIELRVCEFKFVEG